MMLQVKTMEQEVLSSAFLEGLFARSFENKNLPALISNHNFYKEENKQKIIESVGSLAVALHQGWHAQAEDRKIEICNIYDSDRVEFAVDEVKKNYTKGGLLAVLDLSDDCYIYDKDKIWVGKTMSDQRYPYQSLDERVTVETNKTVFALLNKGITFDNWLIFKPIQKGASTKDIAKHEMKAISTEVIEKTNALKEITEQSIQSAANKISNIGYKTINVAGTAINMFASALTTALSKSQSTSMQFLRDPILAGAIKSLSDPEKVYLIEVGRWI